MECINHAGVHAAGTCQICGKALCAECMNRFAPPLCEPCLLSHNASISRRLYIDLGITISIFLVVLIAMGLQTPPRLQAGVFFGVIISCTYWGWQFLSRSTVSIIFTSGAGLVAYMVTKALLSLCLGFIIAPWQIFKRIKEIKSINSLRKQIAKGMV